MPRKRRFVPDTRPDWRDPNMPCYEHSKSRGMIEFTAEQKTGISTQRLQLPAPNWRNDPTYNLRRKPCSTKS